MRNQILALKLFHKYLTLNQLNSLWGMRDCGRRRLRGLCTAAFYLALDAEGPDLQQCHWAPGLCPRQRNAVNKLHEEDATRTDLPFNTSEQKQGVIQVQLQSSPRRNR